MNENPREISFTIPSGASYCVLLHKYQHINDQIHATIEVTPEIWETIDLVMLFNLRWDVRNNGSVSGENNVEIDMIFSKEVYTELLESGHLLTTENDFRNSAKEHPMRGANNWYALSVTENIDDLPEELQNKGTLKMGFSTIWKDDYK